MIELALKAPGSWSVTLDQPPEELVKAIGLRGHIVVTRSDGDVAESRSALLANSQFTGRIDRVVFRSDTVELSGPSIVAWLGDGDGKGPTGSTVSSGSGMSVSAFLAALMTSTRSNGLTLGAVDSAFDFTGAPPSVGLRDVTRQAMQTNFDERWAGDIPWRVTAAGSVTVTRRFQALLLSREGIDGASSGGGAAIPGARIVDIAMELDGSDFVTAVYAQDSSGSFHSATRTAPYGFSTSAAARIHEVETTGSGTATEAATRATNKLAERVDVTRINPCTIEPRPDLLDKVAPGDSVLIWDPASRLVGDGSTVVTLGAAAVHPVSAPVFSVRTPITQDMSVWVASNDWTQIIRCDRWVRYENGQAADLELGAPQRILRPAVRMRW